MRFLFLKISRLIFNVHYTCINICPSPIIHVFEFWHSFPGFCKTVIIQDEAHPPRSAGHFVSLNLLKRMTSSENYCSLLQVLFCPWWWHSRVKRKPAGFFSRWASLYSFAPRICQCTAPPPLGVSAQHGSTPQLHNHAQPTWVLHSPTFPCSAICQLCISWYNELSLPGCPCECFSSFNTAAATACDSASE